MAHLFRLCCLAILLVVAHSASARTIIRDAELEAHLGALADPVLRAAALDSAGVRIFVLADRDINAFVAGGQQLFLNSGLIQRTESPEQLAAVIAHETAHIAGGHLTRTARAAEGSMAQAVMGALLGAAAAVAGAPDLGAALILGGQTVAERRFLAYSRSQEQMADQAAIRYLERAGISPRGLLEFLHILNSQDRLLGRNAAEYLRTHPLTRNRIRFLEEQVAASPLRDAKLPPERREAHARVVAKLDGFLLDPAEVLSRRRGDSLADRYARSIALFRLGRVDEALTLIATLLREREQDPYLHELRGQILFESGRIAAAEPAYREALRLLPQAPLLRLGLAQVLAEQGDGDKLREARALLREVVRLEPRHPTAWRLLGLVESRLGNESESLLALVEWALLTNRPREAALYLARARQGIAPTSAAALRLADLERAVEELKRWQQERPLRRPLLPPGLAIPN